MNKVYLVGNANTGKTSLFNLLTGSNQKVANYHGATTKLAKKNLLGFEDIILYDLPGVYSINGKSKDVELSIQTLKATNDDDLLLFVLDGVYLKSQLKNLSIFLTSLNIKEKKIAIAINMMDEVRANKININQKEIQDNLKIPLFFTSIKEKEGLSQLSSFLSSPELFITSKVDALSENLKKSSTLITGNSLAIKKMTKFDKYFVSSFWGVLAFFAIMLILFQAVFTWATPFMDAIDTSVTFLSDKLGENIKNNYVKSFVQDAIFGGLGSFIVFVPQIFFLKFIIQCLEQSGYLSRAAIVCHKLLSYFGLSGESFISLLTGHACAIPGIYATRHIKSPVIRRLTIFSLPLTLCSARLPVYALVITFLVPTNFILWNLIGLQGLVLFSMYAFGIFMTLIVSKVLSIKYKSLYEPYLALELPRYQIPNFKIAIKDSFKTAWSFIKGAGPIIFFTNLIVWLLATFPNGPGNIKTSYLEKIGEYLTPIFSPLGFGLYETIGVLTSFLARETFVSTLGTLYGASSEESESLLEIIKQSSESFTISSAISLLVFFAIALQCISTLAVIKKEVEGKYIVYYLFFGYFTLAYVLSFLVYNILRFLGY